MLFLSLNKKIRLCIIILLCTFTNYIENRMDGGTKRSTQLLNRTFQFLVSSKVSVFWIDYLHPQLFVHCPLLGHVTRILVTSTTLRTLLLPAKYRFVLTQTRWTGQGISLWILMPFPGKGKKKNANIAMLLIISFISDRKVKSPPQDI